MSDITHPSTLTEYHDKVRSGEAVPTVYHSLIEAAIRDGVAPERIQAAWILRGSLSDLVSIAGAVLIYLQLWWAGVALILLSFPLDQRLNRRHMNVRVGYCALIDPMIGQWAMTKGFLSLIEAREGAPTQFADLNRKWLHRAARDVHDGTSAGTSLLCGALAIGLTLSKMGLGGLLLYAAWQNPSWPTVAVGGTVGAFYLLQSAVRTYLFTAQGCR